LKGATADVVDVLVVRVVCPGQGPPPRVSQFVPKPRRPPAALPVGPITLFQPAKVIEVVSVAVGDANSPGNSQGHAGGPDFERQIDLATLAEDLEPDG